MGLIDGFTRRETLALAETTSNRLQYLERAGLIIPQRVGLSKKPTVLYTWEQVLEIRTIRNLREGTSLQAVRKIIQFLNEHGFEGTLRDKQLVVVDDDVFWVRTDWSDFADRMPEALKVASKNGKGIGNYTLIVIPTLASIVEDIWETAKASQVIDFSSFKERVKNKAA
jgi:DNA-binding transcriptional MerR regulator